MHALTFLFSRAHGRDNSCTLQMKLPGTGGRQTADTTATVTVTARTSKKRRTSCPTGRPGVADIALGSREHPLPPASIQPPTRSRRFGGHSTAFPNSRWRGQAGAAFTVRLFPRRSLSLCPSSARSSWPSSGDVTVLRDWFVLPAPRLLHPPPRGAAGTEEDCL